jgi:hypothetical protein
MQRLVDSLSKSPKLASSVGALRFGMVLGLGLSLLGACQKVNSSTASAFIVIDRQIVVSGPGGTPNAFARHRWLV